MTTATIATTGTGRREKSPDRAVVKIEASGEGATAAEARDVARQTAASIRERVADSTFDVESLRTVKSILRDQSDGFHYDEHNGQYWAAERLVATCTPGRASEFVDIVARGDGTVPTVQFELYDDTRAQVRREALDSAMAEARQRAERLADAENLVITGVYEIEALDDEDDEDTDMEASLAADSSYDSEPGVVTVTETVEVRYEVADAAVAE